MSKKFYDIVSEIDSILEKQDITKQDILKIESLISTYSLKNYFFSNLIDHNWLLPLLKTTIIKDILNDSRNDNQLYLLQVAVTEYLKRVASIYPIQITSLIKKSKPINYNVIWFFAEISLLLPARYTAKLVYQVEIWIKNPYLASSNFASEIIKWFDHLINSQEINEALRLLKILTTPKLQKSKEVRDKEIEKLIGKDRPMAVPVLDHYYMKQMLSKGIKNLIKHNALEVAIVLSTSLEKAIGIEYKGKKGHSDLSFIWRPAIEEHPQNYEHYEFKEALLVSLRNALEIVAASDTENGLIIIKSYLSHKYSIFRRLAIHLLRLNCEKYKLFIKEFIKDKELLRKIEISHEYYTMLRDIFNEILEENERMYIINSLLSYEVFNPKDKPEIQERQKRNFWYGKLYFFERYLKDETKVFYEELKKEFLDEKIIDTPIWSESYYGDKSPITPEELQEKDINEIWHYLKTFRSTKRGFDAPTPEGLASVFGEVVKNNAERFLKENLTPLIDLRPNFSYWFMNQIAEQLKTDKYKNYIPFIDNVLTTCSRLIKLEDIPKRFTDDMGINFTAVKKRILDVIQALVKTHQKELLLDFKNQIWDIIEYLCFYESDPSNVHEEETNMDPFSFALNSVRGTAMHTLIDYALWYAFHTKENFQGEKYPNRFAGEERVQYLLEEKLNKKNDSSLAIHSTFGVFLPNLSYLNFNWVKENLNKIFPKEEENKKYWETAWAGYINASRFYSDLFKFLRPQFIRALNYLSQGKKMIPSGFGRTPEDALSEHLIVACMNGLDSIKRKSSLLRRFAEITHNPSATHSIQFIANLAKDQKIFFDNTALKKKSFWPQAKELWKIRIDVVKKELEKNKRLSNEDEFDTEFSRFFNWLDDLPEHITLKELESLLEETIIINRNGWYIDNFLEYLSKQSNKYPLIAIRLIYESMNTNVPFYFFQRKENKIINVLTNAIKTNEDEGYYYANAIVNKLGEWGIYNYKEFWTKNLKDKKIKKVAKLKRTK